jgi:hypothetical protein
MFEHHKSALLPFPQFLLRTLRFGIYSLVIIIFSVGIGLFGYHYFAGLTWIDSFYNACMILTGMGPVTVLTTGAAKIFSSFYALYSGIAFLTIVAVIFAPVAHRFLHILHIEKDTESEK